MNMNQYIIDKTLSFCQLYFTLFFCSIKIRQGKITLY